jgi:adenylate kinase family enzyme
MIEPFRRRTIILGNSGSGKSTLAEGIGVVADIPVVDLDVLHWEGSGYGAKREEAAARRLVQDAAQQPAWVIEGVYGWLAEVAMPRASALIWLDLPWSVCREGMLARGIRRGGTEATFAELMTWAEAYWQRRSPSSFHGHLRLFEAFPGPKLRLRDREEIRQFLDDLRTDPPS